MAQAEPFHPYAPRSLRPARAGVEPEAFPLVKIRDVPEIVAQEWLVEGLLPRFDQGAAGYVFGPAKARKSLLLGDLALSVATKTDALGRYPVKRQGTVVGFFAEDPKGETSRRIHRLARSRGIAVPDNLMLLDVPALALDNSDHQARLMATLRGIPDLALVWLDPMVRLHSVNDNKAEELGPIHTFLRLLSRACPGAVLVLAHHANKLGESRGSTDYNAFGDFNLYCRCPDELTTEVHRIENRGGPPGKPFSFIVKDGHADAGATLELVAEDLTPEASGQRAMALEQTVIAFRHSNPRASGREALDHVRNLGLRVSSDDFWAIWKGTK